MTEYAHLQKKATTPVAEPSRGALTSGYPEHRLKSESLEVEWDQALAEPLDVQRSGGFMDMPLRHNLSNVRIHTDSPVAESAGPVNVRRKSGAPSLQAKLKVSQPGDRYEREADEVAELVLGMSKLSLTEGKNAQKNSTRASLASAPDQITRKREEDDHSFPGAVHTAELTTATEVAVTDVANGGQPLSGSVRSFFEPRFGHDFSRVRIHTDARAAAAARAVDALAYTRGTHIVFAPQQYNPHSSEGRKLLAHELTHVIQQGAAPSSEVMRKPSYGTAGGDAHAVSEEQEEKTVEVGPASDVPDIQRQSPPSPAPPNPGGGGTPPTPPALASPTLNLTPGAALIRGATLTAAVAFTPSSGETMAVSAWTYTTPAHGTVTRATTEADFQRQWRGVMALSGTLEMQYQITPSGATTPNPAARLQQAITVNDRTGPTWVSAVTQQAERAYAGQPSPPQQFPHLGLHESQAPALPNPTGTTIAGGPNDQFEFVSALVAGRFVSQPNIHPDVTTTTSQFFRFHLNPSRLYLVVGGVRTLIPLNQYSALSTAGGTLTFVVSDWEAFYKRHNFYEVTATSGATTVPVQNAWWGLDANAENANVVITNDAAVRSALGINATANYRFTTRSRGTWDGFQLMQAAAIRTAARSHEYVHAQHSHRANFRAMMRALDPQRLIERTVSTPTNQTVFNTRIADLWTEITTPNHELVDEAASRTAERFVAVAGATMAGVNTDPATGAFLGSVWDITNDQQMT